MNMMLLRDHAKRTHALRGRQQACHCCSDYGSTKAGKTNRQIARQQQRRVEERSWRSEVAA